MEIARRVFSEDNITTKYFQKLTDGYVIETTYVDYSNKHIICFSTQVGCAIGCKICGVGVNNKFERNLTSDEIVKQCENIISDTNIDKNQKPLLFSAMGVGEPMLNYENVIDAMHRLSQKYPNSKFALSTSGIKPKLIRKLKDDSLPLNIFKLQISLHAPNDKLRKKLIPNTKPLKEIIEAVNFFKNNNQNSVEWNYVLLDKINDSESLANQLTQLLGPESYIKLNAFNSFEESKFTSSSDEKVRQFIKKLHDNGMNVENYKTDGSDIMASCGQLKYYKEGNINGDCHQRNSTLQKTIFGR